MQFLQRFEAVASPLPQAEPSLASEPLPIPAGDGPCPFGPSGAMDDDGYSTPHSYGEKATIERTLLAALELRVVEATEANLYDLVLATNAYADDLRERIARFDELEHDLQR
jgi:hypothetical protein